MEAKKVTWFYKWFIMNRKERYFLWLMKMMEEKYYYCCMVEGKELSFKEFLNCYKTIKYRR